MLQKYPLHPDISLEPGLDSSVDTSNQARSFSSGKSRPTCFSKEEDASGFDLDPRTLLHDKTECLPTELLIKVLLWLDPRTLLTVVPAVCRRWRIVAFGLPRQTIDLSFLKPRAKMRQWLESGLAKPLTDIVARRFNVQTIILSGIPRIPGQVIADVSQVSPYLATIDVRRSLTLSDVHLCQLATNCGQLTTVNMCYCTMLTDESVVVLAQCCSQLANVDFRSCFALTDCALAALSEYCAQLLSVVFSDCSNLSDRGVSLLAEGCHRLVKANFGECYDLSDRSLLALASHCSSLQLVDFGQVFSTSEKFTDVGLTLLANSCKQLAVVDFQGSNRLTDASVRALATHCPRLENLSITSNLTITDSAVLSLSENLIRLTLVDLSECKLITDKAIVELARCSGKRLHSLVVAGCDQLTDIALFALCAHCSDLDGVDFDFCKELTDVGTAALARGCTVLTYASFQDCPHLSQRTVDTFAKDCPSCSALFVDGFEDLNSTD